MRRFETATSALVTTLFVAIQGCSPAPPPPPPPPPPKPAAPPPAKPAPPPPAKPAPKPKTLKPTLAKVTDVRRPPAPKGLEQPHKLLTEGKWKEARETLEAKIDELRRNGTLDVKVQAYAMLGFARWQLGDVKEAERAYRRVISYANRPDQQIQKETTDEKEAEHRLAAVMHGIAEAVFFRAEKRRSKLEALPFPAYEGSGEEQEVEAWAKRKVKPWTSRRQRAIERARDEYLQLTKLKPLPGAWAVAAASRTGAMWAESAYLCMEASVPEALTQEGSSNTPKGAAEAPKPAASAEAPKPAAAAAPAGGDAGAPAAAKPDPHSSEALRAAYSAAVGEHCKPFVEEAKAAYEKCQEHANAYDPDGAIGKGCGEWLANKP